MSPGMESILGMHSALELPLLPVLCCPLQLFESAKHNLRCPLDRRTELTPNFVRVLRDSEAEVRVAAAGKVSAFCKCLTPLQIVQHVIPCVRELSMDSSQYVRAALASVVMELAPVMGKQHTIDHLVPVFLTLLKDQYPDVRLNVISKLDQVNQVGSIIGDDNDCDTQGFWACCCCCLTSAIPTYVAGHWY